MLVTCSSSNFVYQNLGKRTLKCITPGKGANGLRYNFLNILFWEGNLKLGEITNEMLFFCQQLYL